MVKAEIPICVTLKEGLFAKFWLTVPCLALLTVLSTAVLVLSCSLICLECK